MRSWAKFEGGGPDDGWHDMATLPETIPATEETHTEAWEQGEDIPVTGPAPRVGLYRREHRGGSKYAYVWQGFPPVASGGSDA